MPRSRKYQKSLKLRKSQRSNKRHSKYAGTVGRFSEPFCPGSSEYRDPDTVDELIEDNEKLCQDDESHFVIDNLGNVVKRLWVDANGHVRKITWAQKNPLFKSSLSTTYRKK